MSETTLAPAQERRPAAPVKEKKQIRDHLESPAFQRQMAMVLPKHLTPSRMVRVAITSMMRKPKLMDCTHESFFNCMLTLSQFGLEPDGRLAHLIPFKNNNNHTVECQLIIDWKGLTQLAYRSGMVSTLHADVIREGDDFEYDAGQLVRHIYHFLRKDKEKPATPGNVIGFYALAKMKDGSPVCTVMSKEQVDGIRRRSKSANDGPWVTDYEEMGKKTAFRRLSKWMPLSSEYRDALDADDDGGDSLDDLTNVTGTADSAAMTERFAGPAPTPQISTQVEEPTKKPHRQNAPPPKPQELLPQGDAKAELSAILASVDAKVPEFAMAMHADGKVGGQGQIPTDSILTMDNVSDDLVAHYLGADRKGAPAMEAVRWFRENQ